MNIRVAAILIKDGQILLVNHRRLGRSYWVLPGGKLKPGETLEACVRREVWEEAGLKVSVKQLLYLSECISPKQEKQILDVFFLGEIQDGDLSLNTKVPLEQPKFIDLDTLPDLPLYPPIAFEILEDLQNGFQEGGRYLGNLWIQMEP